MFLSRWAVPPPLSVLLSSVMPPSVKRHTFVSGSSWRASCSVMGCATVVWVALKRVASEPVIECQKNPKNKEPIAGFVRRQEKKCHPRNRWDQWGESKPPQELLTGIYKYENLRITVLNNREKAIF